MSAVISSEISPDSNLLMIIGLPRSGTHLLRFALSKSGDVQFTPETAIFYKYWGGRNLRKIFGEKRFSDCLAESIMSGHGDPTMLEFQSSHEEIRASLCKEPTIESIIDTLNAFHDHPKMYIGEKTPNNTLFLRAMLRRSRPHRDIKILQINRNIYDQIASSVRTAHIGGGVSEALARYFVYQKALRGLRVFSVQFEELVKQPELTMKSICKYLGVNYHASMLVPGVMDSSEGESFFQTGDIGFDKSTIGNGKERLGPEVIDLIDQFLSFGPRGLPWGAYLQFWAHVLRLRRNQLAAMLGIVTFKTMLRSLLVNNK